MSNVKFWNIFDSLAKLSAVLFMPLNSPWCRTMWHHLTLANDTIFLVTIKILYTDNQPGLLKLEDNAVGVCMLLLISFVYMWSRYSSQTYFVVQFFKHISLEGYYLINVKHGVTSPESTTKAVTLLECVSVLSKLFWKCPWLAGNAAIFF